MGLRDIGWRLAAATVALMCAFGIAAGAAAQESERRALAEIERIPAPVANPPAVTYRTICVRLCDGYYFPISTVAPRTRLEADAAQCTASCSSEARLFFHLNPGGDVASARDFTGLHYESLSNAFRYLKQAVDGCRCRPEPWSSTEVQRHQRYAAQSLLPETTGTVVASQDAPFDFTAQDERPLAVRRRAAPDAEATPPNTPVVETPALSLPRSPEPARLVPAADKITEPQPEPKVEAVVSRAPFVVPEPTKGKAAKRVKTVPKKAHREARAAQDCKLLSLFLRPHSKRG
ncbi:MAG: DUF2865 domain-containing protein [Hyphomicrobiales bacterium]|nr:MAG: DUF2865 domain-containing protein [Hyphomicrobiales bacterium]